MSDRRRILGIGLIFVGVMNPDQHWLYGLLFGLGLALIFLDGLRWMVGEDR